MTISDFNQLVEDDYNSKKLHERNEQWYPLIKYNTAYGRDIDLSGIKILSVGLNPSLTVPAILDIHVLLGLDPEDYKNGLISGLQRYDKYMERTEEIDQELIKYQYRLKYESPILYFKHLDDFFNEVGYDFKSEVFHYDFIPIRETKSRKIIKRVKANQANNDLMFTAIQHFERIVQIVDPRLIFVFNAQVSSLLRSHAIVTKEPHQYQNFGCYQMKGNAVPVLLANQLSGGATSIIYREMLQWMAKQLLASYGLV